LRPGRAAGCYYPSVGSRVVFWDFEGTLAVRRGIWAQCLVDVLDRLEPGHGRTDADFAPWLRRGFPWHDWERAHPELIDADAWWAALQPVLANACVRAGLDPGRARRAAAGARECYVDPVFWQVYEDVRPALASLRAAGWRQAILSNHVPELPDLARTLGLCDLVETVLTSAATGFEKPHPRMFAVALDAMGGPDAAWMVGDNPVADVGGAEAVGIPAILVRRGEDRARRQVRDVAAAARVILEDAQ
jgi:putative hydrolase of the HAD superfamily